MRVRAGPNTRARKPNVGARGPKGAWNGWRGGNARRAKSYRGMRLILPEPRHPFPTTGNGFAQTSAPLSSASEKNGEPGFEEGLNSPEEADAGAGL